MRPHNADVVTTKLPMNGTNHKHGAVKPSYTSRQPSFRTRSPYRINTRPRALLPNAASVCSSNRSAAAQHCRCRRCARSSLPACLFVLASCAWHALAKRRAALHCRRVLSRVPWPRWILLAAAQQAQPPSPLRSRRCTPSNTSSASWKLACVPTSARWGARVQPRACPCCSRRRVHALVCRMLRPC